MAATISVQGRLGKDNPETVVIIEVILADGEAMEKRLDLLRVLTIPGHEVKKRIAI